MSGGEEMITDENNNTLLNKQFEQASKEFEVHWEMGREAAKSAKLKINEMISILYQQHEDWSFNKIANTIWTKHEHLDGFAKTTIYRNLDESNRTIFHKNRIPHGIQKLQNNVPEESVPGLVLNVPEESSSTISISSNSNSSVANPELEDFRQQKGTKIMGEAIDSVYDLEDEDGNTEPHVIYDDPQKIMRQNEEQIIQINKKYEELERRYSDVIAPYKDQGAVISPEGKEYIVKAKADPYKRTIDFEFNLVPATKKLRES